MRGRKGTRYINYEHTTGESDLIWGVEKSVLEQDSQRGEKEHSKQKEQLVQDDRGRRKMSH